MRNISIMSHANKISRKQVSNARQRLPRKAKANDHVSIMDKPVTRPELTEKSVNIRKPQEDVAASSNQKFEFVTLTSEPSTITTRETSKTVRKQAMNDYLRKQNRQATTGIPQVVESVHLDEPSRYKGKFKLNTWTHKTKTKAILARRVKSLEEQDAISDLEDLLLPTGSSSTLTIVSPWSLISSDRPPLRIFSPSTASLDPFNTSAIRLGPNSEKLLVHYNTMYSMNSVAINAESNFFSFVKIDPALFHSILYLVALHRDIWYGLVDSPICLYHGSEAFRIINDRLQKSVVFDDATIAAVAMLVNKENLNGRYDLSKMHMEGLRQMVQTRGGPQSLSGVFRRIVTWSDFCFANVWNIQPSYSRLHPTPPTSPTSSSLQLDPTSKTLKASHLFGNSSPIIPIIDNLRTLTQLLPPSRIPFLTTSSRMHASNLIYDTEYSILAINPPSISPDSFAFSLSKCAVIFESLPLRIALYLYLYLSIRLVPKSSELTHLMLLRLKDSLEQIGIMEWWESDAERRVWLLWILWMGTAAAWDEEKWWFVGEFSRLCGEMEIWDLEILKERLRVVIWEEEWCGEMVEGSWEDVIGRVSEAHVITEVNEVTD